MSACRITWANARASLVHPWPPLVPRSVDSGEVVALYNTSPPSDPGDGPGREGPDASGQGRGLRIVSPGRAATALPSLSSELDAARQATNHRAGVFGRSRTRLPQKPYLRPVEKRAVDPMTIPTCPRRSRAVRCPRSISHFATDHPQGRVVS